MEKFYIHTINGRPAVYVEGEQVSYVGGRIKLSELARCTSLYQLREEQRLSREWREAKGWEDDDDYDYFILYFD